jgi:ABC-type Fe3+ transport system permease subunit
VVVVVVAFFFIMSTLQQKQKLSQTSTWHLKNDKNDTEVRGAPKISVVDIFFFVLLLPFVHSFI